MSVTASTSNRSIECSATDLVDRMHPTAPTMLAVWAHPDDESYLGGGLMAAVAAVGGRVVNMSATLGEHGTDDPDRLPPTTLAGIRRRELGTALSHLGVSRSLTLGYTDGACDQVPTRLGARRVTSVIDEVDPDLVLTFGPDGVTGHPDHRAVGRWVSTAMSDRPSGAALLTTAVGETWPADLVDGMHRVGAFYPGYPERLGRGPRWDVAVESDVLDRKLAALHSHRSQIGPVHDQLGRAGYRRLASVEAYRPANTIASQLFGGRQAPERAAA